MKRETDTQQSFKPIDYLDLGNGLYIENNELKERVDEHLDNDEFVSWEEGWSYVLDSLNKIKEYQEKLIEKEMAYDKKSDK